ncbi:MAG: D-alanine--D-alanine ligase [Deltaproteobacteria bacterium]|nr:D-alanine--D-alanine ligase [Deltaproteobacteria bacterium]
MGGMSSEREVSLCSGMAVYKALKGKGYKVVAVDAGRDTAKVIEKKKIKLAFIALHGKYGEDGTIQGLLEIMGIPYTGSGVLASGVAFDKAAAKEIFRFHGIPTPDWQVIRNYELGIKNYELRTTNYKFPLVVKPARQGSTIGLTVVKDKKDLQKAIKKAFRFDNKIVLERFIQGREVTVGILSGEPLPVVEIKPKKGLYDYRSKYTKGMTDYIAPAPLEKGVECRVKEAAINAYNALGCCGAARVDVCLDKKNDPYVLELNTVPGLTELSLLPKAARCAGIDFTELIERMLLAVRNKG